MLPVKNVLENPYQPRYYDAVKGGQNPPPITGAVLGGVPGVKKRLASADVEQRLAALKDALNYGQKGLYLVIRALQDESRQVRREAYLLLRERSEQEVRRALQKFNPYQLLRCAQTLRYHTKAVNSIAFSPDGQILASGSFDQTIKLWHMRKGQELPLRIGHRKSVNRIAFSPDGQILVSSGEDKTIKLWQVRDGRKLSTHVHPGSGFFAFSPDGKTIATGNTDIKLWDAGTGKHLQTLSSFLSVACFAFSPDGQLLATSNLQGTIKLWQVSTGWQIRTLTFDSGRVCCVAFSPNGQILATSGDDQTIKLWQVSTGQQICAFIGNTDSVHSVVFSPNGQMLAGCKDDTIKLWQVSTGWEICNLTGHADAITSIAFSPDGQTLASSSYDKTIKIWRFD